MSKTPFMQLYVADYLADTSYLDVVESGAYLHLLMNYWQTGKPLPNDDKKLARISRCTEEQWLNVRSTIVPFFIERDDVLYHRRVERDLEKVRDKSTKASEAGKKSGKVRKPVTDVEQTLNDRSTDAEQTLNHTDTDTDTDTDTKADFNKKDSASAESLITGKPVSEGVGIQDFFDRWNRFADKTPKLTGCRKLTDKRRAKIRSRLNDAGWFEDFKEAVCALPLGGDGWQPGLDWLIRNEHNIYLIMEGAFDFRNRDDPAAQKLAAQRRKSAFNQREAEERCRTEQLKQELDGRQKAIANISPAQNGNAEELAAVSLLFGTDEGSFVSGVED